MNRGLLVGLCIFVLSVVPSAQNRPASGKWEDKAAHFTADEDKAAKALTEDDLRPALLRTIRAYPLAFSSSTRKVTETAVLRKRKELNGLIDLGSFRCDLEKRTFTYSAGGYWGPGYANGSIRGHFILNERSEWVGKLTGMIRKGPLAFQQEQAVMGPGAQEGSTATESVAQQTAAVSISGRS
jgi:hypothetical protein